MPTPYSKSYCPGPENLSTRPKQKEKWKLFRRTSNFKICRSGIFCFHIVTSCLFSWQNCSMSFHLYVLKQLRGHSQIKPNIQTVWFILLSKIQTHFDIHKTFKEYKNIQAISERIYSLWCIRDILNIVTVEPRLTATSLVWPPRYYGHILLSRRNAHTFSYNKTPFMRPPR